MSSDPLANPRLAALLREAGWPPEALARRITLTGRDRPVHPKTPYKWIARGNVPHGDVPDLVVQVLSRALGRELTHEDVWGVTPRRPPRAVGADDRMDLPWDRTGLLSLLGEPVPTRRTVLALAGTALTRHGWMALASPGFELVSAAAEDGPVTPALLTMIDGVVRQAQLLDDEQGGAARGFVGDQFAAVARLLRRASYDQAAGRRLTTALAQLAQTAGFMAFDAHDDGRAQRWYLVGARAAHAAADPALVASVLALMSNQAADRGKATDAVNLAAAAQEAAADTHAVVRSLVAARSGLAYAAAGDLTGFLRVRDTALGLLDGQGDRPRPPWAWYVDRVELDAITGRGLVVLAEHLPTRRKKLLRDACHLLHARAHTPPDGKAQRSALRHGAWLSLARIADHDLDGAVAAGRLAYHRLCGVDSARSRALLHDLGARLAPVAGRSASARSLLHDLEHLPRRS